MHVLKKRLAFKNAFLEKKPLNFQKMHFFLKVTDFFKKVFFGKQLIF